MRKDKTEALNKIRFALKKFEEQEVSAEPSVEEDFTGELDLLTAVEKIVEMAENSKMSKEFFEKADRFISYVSDKMDLTKVQSVFMALFIDWSDERKIRTSEFGDYLDCGTTRMLRYSSDIDVLEQRDFVRCNHDDRYSTYMVPSEIIEAFKNDEKYVPRDCSNLSCQELFEELAVVFGMRMKKELTYENMVCKIHRLFEQNRRLLFVQNLRKYGLEEDDEILLIYFSHLFVNDSDDNVTFRELDALYDNLRKFSRMRMLFSVGDHVLLKRNIVDYVNEDGFVKTDYYRLSRDTKEALFSELDLRLLNPDRRRGDMIKSEEIVAKEMFYDQSVSRQISALKDLLDEENYNQVRSRMQETGFRCGFTCLFYGMPGTGKTETVLQLARQTGRDIMQVNISQIKSKWVGDSEKNIKQVFENYKSQVKMCERTPILLFNEADAIISRRMEGAEHAVDKMENTIQNIILQEMETLDGILIATTNLEQNMDKAFERRFLYKVKFEKPTVEARMNMWLEMIPALNDDDARRLAMKYDFSGGQIENIARHYTIGHILHGEPEDIFEQLCVYCNEERLEKDEKCVMGFSA